MIKIDRINSELKKQIAHILDTEIKHPAIADEFLTVTKVKTTPDLKFCKVYVSILGDDKSKVADIMEALAKSSGFIRTKLKGLVNIRNIPALTFVVDDSLEYTEKINKILDEIKSEETNK